MRYSKVLAFAILLAALTSVPRSAPAQVSINIGPEPAYLYGYTTTRHTTALRTGTMGPSGSAAAYSSEPALGSTVRTTSMVT
jgi:hypothetical protein